LTQNRGRWFDSDFVQLYHPRAMGQRYIPRLAIFFLALSALMMGGCGKAAAPATQAAAVTVASTVPAATDMILEMGAGDHLVAVSNLEGSKKGIEALPHIGDYQSIDWEKLAQVRPKVLIVQINPARMPAGIAENAHKFGMRLLNLHIERLNDTFTALDQIGDALDERPKAAAAGKKLHDKLDAVKARVAGEGRVPTLVFTNEGEQGCAGRDNFVNDMLEIAGGENVLKSRFGSWPSVDREMIASLKPQAVLELLPNAKPIEKENSRRFWQTMEQVPAVRDARVYLLSQSFVLLPGIHVGETTELFANCLHPVANGNPASKDAP
jgi:ABC-type Fe3+-hydroxamate transport system substrate-binding protein